MDVEKFKAMVHSQDVMNHIYSFTDHAWERSLRRLPPAVDLLSSRTWRLFKCGYCGVPMFWATHLYINVVEIEKEQVRTTCCTSCICISPLIFSSYDVFNDVSYWCRMCLFDVEYCTCFAGSDNAAALASVGHRPMRFDEQEEKMREWQSVMRERHGTVLTQEGFVAVARSNRNRDRGRNPDRVSNQYENEGFWSRLFSF